MPGLAADVANCFDHRRSRIYELFSVTLGASFFVTVR